MTVAGLLLAAGAGRRMGGPKALLRGLDGVPFVVRALAALRDGGCRPLLVVVGSAGDEVTAHAAGARVVRADDWPEGMGASLRAGLESLAVEPGGATAALVTLVDLPDVGACVVRRVLAGLATEDSRVLGRACYDGTPGHPVVLGADHWAAAAEAARGDRGARDYLAGRQVALVECGDLATGRDVDTPEQHRVATRGPDAE